MFREILARLIDSGPHFSKQLKNLPFLPLAVAEYRLIDRDDGGTEVALVATPDDSDMCRMLERKADCRAVG